MKTKQETLRWPGHWNALALAMLLGGISCSWAQEAVPVIAPRDLGAELNTFLGTSVNSEAVAVNDAGQVVINVVSLGHAYLWSADAGFVDLGTLGGNYCQAGAINSAGHVVGYRKSAEGDIRAFLWTPETGIQDLVTDSGPVPYTSSVAWFINEQGQVAGLATPLMGMPHAVWWGTGLDLMDIHDDTVGPVDVPMDLNNLGQVVGYTGDGKLNIWAFVWDAASGMRVLALPEGDIYLHSWAYSINDRGEAVGASGAHDDSPPSPMAYWARACRWSPEGVPQLLEQTGCWFSEAYDVNNAGQVVGFSTVNFSDTDPGHQHATLWTPNGEGMVQVDLGTLDETLFSECNALAINELGQVIGISSGYGGSCGVAWTEPVGMVELGDLGQKVTGVVALNNVGLVVGKGWTDGLQHACVWQLPLPPLTPQEEVEAIVDELIEMVDTGILDEGEGTELVVTLEGAANKFAEEQTKPAENMLQAFINKIEAKVKSGKLSPEDGAALIVAASAVLEDLED